MSRPTTISVSSESDSPGAITVTSAHESVQTISSDRNPGLALVSEIISVSEEDDEQQSDGVQHVSSESEDLEVLEAEAETARARREEREALERLAKARRSRGSNSSVRSTRSQRSLTSHVSQAQVEVEAPQVPANPPATPTMSTAPAHAAPLHVPELPTTQPSWLQWFASHAPRRHGPMTQAEAQLLANAGVDVQNPENSAFTGPYISVRERVAELERVQTARDRVGDPTPETEIGRAHV